MIHCKFIKTAKNNITVMEQTREMKSRNRDLLAAAREANAKAMIPGIRLFGTGIGRRRINKQL